MKPIISIIIPVYNVEGYIGKTLDSIYNQKIDLNVFEVIVINDGSSDGSLDIINIYNKKYTNIVLVSQDNHGVSFSRNKALEITKARYVTFLDGDDMFLPGSLQKTINFIEENDDVDVLYENLYIDNGNLWFKSHKVPNGVIEGNCYNVSELKFFCNGAGSVCGGFYSVSFLRDKGLQFAEGVANGEDTIFTYFLLSFNPKIYFKDIDLYLVTVRQGSATHSKSVKRARKCRLNIDYLTGYIESNNLTPFRMEFVHKALWQAVGLATSLYINCGIYDKSIIVNELGLLRVPFLHITDATIGQKIKIFLYNHFYDLYIKLFVIRERITKK